MDNRTILSTPETTLDTDDNLNNWITEFYRAKIAEGLAENSIKFYRRGIGEFARYCENQVIERVSQITPNVIRSYLLYLQENGHNPGGVHAKYRTVKVFMFWYEKEAEPAGWKNPILKVKAPRVPERPLDPVEIETVLSMARTCDPTTLIGSRDKAILLFLLDTGVRRFELLAINRIDVNFSRGSVLIRRGKGGKPRTVFMGHETQKAVRDYIAHRSDENPALWVTDDQKYRLKAKSLEARLMRISKRAGVDQPSPHAFRRAFALNMLRNGVDIYSLQKLMGHSDIGILRRYLAQTDNDTEKAHHLGSPVDNAKRRGPVKRIRKVNRR